MPTRPGYYWHFTGQSEPCVTKVLLGMEGWEPFLPGCTDKLVICVEDGMTCIVDPQFVFLDEYRGQWSEMIEPPDSFVYVEPEQSRLPDITILDTIIPTKPNYSEETL